MASEPEVVSCSFAVRLGGQSDPSLEARQLLLRLGNLLIDPREFSQQFLTTNFQDWFHDCLPSRIDQGRWRSCSQTLLFVPSAKSEPNFSLLGPILLQVRQAIPVLPAEEGRRRGLLAPVNWPTLDTGENAQQSKDM